MHNLPRKAVDSAGLFTARSAAAMLKGQRIGRCTKDEALQPWGKRWQAGRSDLYEPKFLHMLGDMTRAMLRSKRTLLTLNVLHDKYHAPAYNVKMSQAKRWQCLHYRHHLISPENMT